MRNTDWVGDISSALNSLGGIACLPTIYEEVRRIRKQRRRAPVLEMEASVRSVLQTNLHIFLPLNKGHGIWGLRQAVANALV